MGQTMCICADSSSRFNAELKADLLMPERPSVQSIVEI